MKKDFKIKKRVLISIVLTTILTCMLYEFWFVFKPLSASLKLSGKTNKTNITIIFNRRNNNKFHKTKKDNKIVTIKNETKADFKINDIKFPKRLRIDFSNLKNDDTIILKEISLKDEKIKINDFKNFSLQGGDLEIKKDELIIHPKEETCKLLYGKKLTFFAPIKLEVELLLIIAILSYLLIYKSTDYIANFKTIKSKSRIEIVFLISFFVILFLPSLHIDKSDISTEENRNLAKWKPLINENKTINYNFGKDVDNFFSDRFYMRDDFIKLYYNQFIINKNLRTKKVIKGKDNWLFHGHSSAVAMYKRENLFSKESLVQVGKLLTKYDNYCKKNNKHFYLYIAPSKSMIYSEFYNDSIKPSQNNNLTLANQLTQYLRKNTDVKVIYPKDEIIRNKNKSLLYFKTDTHWNEYGAYIGYSVLMKEINKDLKLKHVNILGFEEALEHSGDLNKNLPKALRIKKYEKYKKPLLKENSYNCLKTQDTTDIQYCKSSLNNKALLMFRDSFTTNLIPYLASTFKISKYVWQPEVDFSLMENADVIILELVEVNLSKLIGIKTEF